MDHRAAASPALLDVSNTFVACVASFKILECMFFEVRDFMTRYVRRELEDPPPPEHGSARPRAR